MAEEKLDEVEQPLPSKRKPSSAELESPQQSSKLQKLEANSPSCHPPNINKQNGALFEDEEDEEDYEESEEDDEDEDEDGGRGVDKKGKGIMKEDIKGKGKLIEADSSDDDDDDDDDGSDIVDDSDLDEDPLAEVDLDNILPSRTRGRGRPPPPSSLSLSDNATKHQGN